jgi:hypothetical protein
MAPEFVDEAARGVGMLGVGGAAGSGTEAKLGYHGRAAIVTPPWKEAKEAPIPSAAAFAMCPLGPMDADIPWMSGPRFGPLRQPALPMAVEAMMVTPWNVALALQVECADFVADTTFATTSSV